MSPIVDGLRMLALTCSMAFSGAEFCEGGYIATGWMELGSLIRQYLIWLAILVDAVFEQADGVFTCRIVMGNLLPALPKALAVLSLPSGIGSLELGRLEPPVQLLGV